MNYLQVFLEGTETSSRQAALRSAYLFNECSDKKLTSLLRLPELHKQFNTVQTLLETDKSFSLEIEKLYEDVPTWLVSSVRSLQENDEELFNRWATGQYQIPDARTYDPFASAPSSTPSVPAPAAAAPSISNPIDPSTGSPLDIGYGGGGITPPASFDPSYAPAPIPSIAKPVASVARAALSQPAPAPTVGTYSPDSIPFAQAPSPIQYSPAAPDTAALTGAATTGAGVAKSGLAAFAAANPLLAIGGAAAAAILASAGGYSLYQAYQKTRAKQAAKLEGPQAKEALRQTCIGVLNGLRNLPITDRPKAIVQGLKDAGAVSYMKDGKLRTLKNYATIVQAVNDLDKVDVFYYKPEGATEPPQPVLKGSSKKAEEPKPVEQAPIEQQQPTEEPEMDYIPESKR